MADRHLLSARAGERQHGRLRAATNRRIDLALQQELDDVNRKSIEGVKLMREVRRQEPLTEPQATAEKLGGEFVPKRPPFKRKTQPVFHEELKQPPDHRPKTPKLPLYNPLEKDKNMFSCVVMETDKSNKFPFNRQDTITTVEMKKPHTTSLGIIPPRHSQQVTNLKVVLEGIPNKKGEDTEISAVEQANVAPEAVDEGADNVAYLDAPVQDCEEMEYKPAIVSSVGTTQNVVLQHRVQPPPKPRSTLKHKHGRVKSGGVRREPVQEEEMESQVEVKVKLEEDRSLTSSVHTAKSAKELLEEAQRITSPSGAEELSVSRRASATSLAKSAVTHDSKDRIKPARKPGLPQQARRTVTDKKKMTSSRSSKSSWSDSKSQITKAEDAKPNTERTVDDIIAALRNQSHTGQISESDRKKKKVPTATLR